ncbi:MAG TPA: hypothetical protein VG347_17020 [Verrucomicrobiae bacterium]|nr:hypothetical protein [Verrucomicrobiae bacterium]
MDCGGKSRAAGRDTAFERTGNHLYLVTHRPLANHAKRRECGRFSAAFFTVLSTSHNLTVRRRNLSRFEVLAIFHGRFDRQLVFKIDVVGLGVFAPRKHFFKIGQPLAVPDLLQEIDLVLLLLDAHLVQDFIMLADAERVKIFHHYLVSVKQAHINPQFL